MLILMEVKGDRGGTRILLFRNPDGENVLVVVSDGLGPAFRSSQNVSRRFKAFLSTLMSRSV